MAEADPFHSPENLNPPSSPNKPIYEYDHAGTLIARCRNAWNILTGRLGEDARETYILEAEIKRWPKDCAKCEKYRQFLFNYSPIVRFMNEKITALGGDLSVHSFPCTFCTGQKSGGFDPDHGVILCANKLGTQRHVEDTMAHGPFSPLSPTLSHLLNRATEMIHVYDHLRFKVDWDDLRHAACSEIRASSLSGDCPFMKEFFGRGKYKVTMQHQECVRRRAMQSIMARPNCKDDVHAARVLNDVWGSCFGDTRPFDEIYR